AAVGRLVHAAVAALAPERPLRRDENDVGVPRIDDDAADVLRVLQAEVGPALPAVDRLVDPVAVGNHPLGIVLTGADPDHVRILLVDGDHADREGAFPVEDRGEADPGVAGLPDAA